MAYKSKMLQSPYQNTTRLQKNASHLNQFPWIKDNHEESDSFCPSGVSCHILRRHEIRIKAGLKWDKCENGDLHWVTNGSHVSKIARRVGSQQQTARDTNLKTHSMLVKSVKHHINWARTASTGSLLSMNDRQKHHRSSSMYPPMQRKVKRWRRSRGDVLELMIYV